MKKYQQAPPLHKFGAGVLVGKRGILLIKGLRPQGALASPGGKLSAKLTDEDCGQKPFRISKVGTYSGLSAKKKYQPSQKSECSRPSSSSVSPLRASHLPPEGRQGACGAFSLINKRTLSSTNGVPCQRFPPSLAQLIQLLCRKPGLGHGGGGLGEAVV